MHKSGASSATERFVIRSVTLVHVTIRHGKGINQAKVRETAGMKGAREGFLLSGEVNPCGAEPSCTPVLVVPGGY